MEDLGAMTMSSQAYGVSISFNLPFYEILQENPKEINDLIPFHEYYQLHCNGCEFLSQKYLNFAQASIL